MFLIVFFCSKISAQEFTGFVKKTDSAASPIFQAKVEILESEKMFSTLKTYFDGSFRFIPGKDKTLTIKITYPGYIDTTYTITSDKNGYPSAQNITVHLKKDGMRLMGTIKSRTEDFPIKDATIVLKNVMTRKEDRITTDIDGKYNFKLEYETNYRVSIDKRSPGVLNKFKDTTFYISTTGFNQPLDYKLDIALNEMIKPVTPAHIGYTSTKQSENRNMKPVVDTAASKNRNSASHDTILKLRAELEKTQKLLEDIMREKEAAVNKKSTDSPFSSKNTEKKASYEAEVAKMKELAEKSARETEEKIATQKREEKEKADLVAKQKAINDSITRAKHEKLYTDSIAKLKAATEKMERETVLKKHREDSLANIRTIVARKKFVADSIAFVKEFEDNKRKEEAVANKKIPQEDVARQAKEDSLKKATVRAEHEKFVKDSMAHVNLFAEKKKKEEAARNADKKKGGGMEALTVQEKLKQDSALRAKAKQDSLSLKQKVVADSALRMKVQAAPLVDIAPLKSTYLTKTQEELIKAAEAFAKRKKLAQDSLAATNKKQEETKFPEKPAKDTLGKKQ